MVEPSLMNAVRERGPHKEALDLLLPRLYAELHRLASRCRRRERRDHTLQTTALLNEAYLRLARTRRLAWNDRSHLMAITARIMRRILVDHGRGNRSLKRGGGAAMVSVQDIGEIGEIAENGELGDAWAPDLLDLDEALCHLAELDPELSKLVELLFFAGLSQGEAAAALGISKSTVERRWRTAKLWLLRHLQQTHPPDERALPLPR